MAMLTTRFSAQILRPASITGGGVTSRRVSSARHFNPPENFKPRKIADSATALQNLKWACTLSHGDQSTPEPTVDVEQLVDVLCDNLQHMFDDQGIDSTVYDERIMFRDPITKYDTLTGYLFNIHLLKVLFRPQLHLHWVKQTRPYEITMRWTVTMKFILLPWKPELVLTGTSVMGVNPNNGKFCSHVDYWDSIEKNDYFSLEGLVDVIKQLQINKASDWETPKYLILKRTANYEVRKYAGFTVVETNGDKISGSTGFNDVARYIFGKNSIMEKMPMTMPVFTEAYNAELSDVCFQIVLPSDKDISSLPNPSREKVILREVEGGIAAALKFSGKLVEDIVWVKERELRSSLLRDGLKPKKGCLLARYNDPGRTWSFTMRNEVLIWLEEYTLD